MDELVESVKSDFYDQVGIEAVRVFPLGYCLFIIEAADGETYRMKVVK